MVDLVPVNKENIWHYKTFEENFDACLKPFLSRIFPCNYEQYEELTKQKQLIWDFIFFDKKLIGSVWLEK